MIIDENDELISDVDKLPLDVYDRANLYFLEEIKYVKIFYRHFFS